MNENQTIYDDAGNYVSGSRESVKDQGEVMTPPHIVDAMLNQIPDEVWSDPTYVFLEPSCGTGNFLVAIVERRLQYHTIEVALNTVFGMECNRETLHVSRQRLMEIALRETPNIIDGARQRLMYIVCNNIFHVEDTVSFLANKRFDEKFFIYDDPTGHHKIVRSMRGATRERTKEGHEEYFNKVKYEAIHLLPFIQEKIQCASL